MKKARIVSVIIFLVLTGVIPASVWANNTDVVITKNLLYQKDIPCNKDITNYCQTKIINLLNNTHVSLLIDNYDFSNQMINIAIHNLITRGVAVIIYTDIHTFIKYKSNIVNWTNNYNTICYSTNIKEFKQDEFFVLDDYIVIRGFISENLRTDEINKTIRPKLKSPKAIQFLKSTVIADTFINKFESHIKHSNLYTNQ